MKKILTLIVAAATISFASCGSKTTSATSEIDSIAAEAAVEQSAPAAEQAQAVIALLQEQIQNADQDQIKAISDQIAQKVAEFIAQGDEAAAQTYIETISNFINTNAEKLKAIGASTTITETISAVEGVPAGIIESVTNAANGVAATATEQAAAAQAAVDAAQTAVEAAPEAAKAAAEQAAAAAQQKAQEAAAAAQQQAKDKANEAIDNAAAAAKQKLGL